MFGMAKKMLSKIIQIKRKRHLYERKVTYTHQKVEKGRNFAAK
jgi:hypothetical protein